MTGGQSTATVMVISASGANIKLHIQVGQKAGAVFMEWFKVKW